MPAERLAQADTIQASQADTRNKSDIALPIDTPLMLLSQPLPSEVKHVLLWTGTYNFLKQESTRRG